MTTGGKILIADDDEFFRRALLRTLEAAGYDAEAVEDAPTALERLAQEVFDLLVSDVNMPGNEGLAVLSRQTVVPVLLVTGDPSMETAIAALRGSAIDYLEKPIPPKELLRRVEEGVVRGRTLRSLRSAEARLNGQLELVAGLRRTLENTGIGRLPPTDSELPAPIVEVLSKRELELASVFHKSPKVEDIAASLHISPHTVKNHLRNIYKKLGVRSRAELMRRLDEATRKRG